MSIVRHDSSSIPMNEVWTAWVDAKNLPARRKSGTGPDLRQMPCFYFQAGG